ncbi:MAG: FAD/NAD(P)-binding protein [Clostridiales bacterium]|nr:FAD/NAD(P)-binding protein [Clostridiales bacterium]
MNNPYIPSYARIEKVTQETTSDTQDVKTYRLNLKEPLDYAPGQFLEVGIPGKGEAPFGFASTPLEKDHLDLTIKRTGSLTDVIHTLREGDGLWLRGPFGNTFPLDAFEGYDLFYAAGGLGLAPLRPMIDTIFHPDWRKKYGKITMLLAARTPRDFIFSYDYEKWAAMPDTTLYQTIDRMEEGWDKLVGFPNTLIPDIPFDKENTIAVLCGPPLMIKALSNAFADQGMPLDHIYTTMEMRMSCGVGKCGRCNIGKRYVCVDGPVFSMTELAAMPNEY